MRFNFPTVVKNLLILNAIFFVGTYFIFGAYQGNIINLLSLHFPGTPAFKPWQFVTYMFMHAGFSHIFFNMLGLVMFGAELETYWGPKRFLTYYMISGLGAAALHLIIVYFQFQSNGLDMAYAPPMLGASGAIFGVLAAYGFTFPNREIFSLMIPIPIKAKYWVMIYGAMELFFGLRAQDNVAHFAHLGGMFAGIIVMLYWKKKGIW